MYSIGGSYLCNLQNDLSDISSIHLAPYSNYYDITAYIPYAVPYISGTIL